MLKKGIGEAFGQLFFSQSRVEQIPCPLVEGFRRPSLRSGLLKPSTKGPFPKPQHISPFELAAVSFCSRPDREKPKLSAPGPPVPRGDDAQDRLDQSKTARRL